MWEVYLRWENVQSDEVQSVEKCTVWEEKCAVCEEQRSRDAAIQGGDAPTDDLPHCNSNSDADDNGDADADARCSNLRRRCTDRRRLTLFGCNSIARACSLPAIMSKLNL